MDVVCQPPAVRAWVNRKRTVLLVCLLLAAAVATVFGRTLRHPFVNFDDDVYVYENPAVCQGLTFDGIVWAFTRYHSNNWHPLTWLSHMLDCRWYGLNAGGHHFTSILIHSANAILLFLLMRRMTGALGTSAFVAALFAVHPLHVESVAWVAERKDVLSGWFFMLVLWTYVRYVEQSRIGKSNSVIFYGFALIFFALGLMSKPMLVTVPLVLLLLDYWPLRRYVFAAPDSQAQARVHPILPPPSSTLWPLVREKLPFLLLSAGSCAITLLAQREVIRPMTQLPFSLRFSNALVASATYMGQMIWPKSLAVFYPHPLQIPAWQLAGAGMLLVSITGFAIVTARRLPYLPAGWFWFLGMLLPVIGLVQVGDQGLADRYTYLPQIGLYWIVAWGISDWTRSWRRRQQILSVVAVAAILILMLGAWRQTGHWRNSESLWKNALACAPDNYLACNNLGNALVEQGRSAEAAGYFEKALAVHPNYPEAYNNLGTVRLGRHQFSEAAELFLKAIEIRPGYPEAQNNLGTALASQGQAEEAMTRFQKAIELRPDYANAHFNLANLFAARGELDEAAAHYRRAAELQPQSTHASYRLGLVLQRGGKFAGAIAQFQKIAGRDAHHVGALNNLAWLRATCPEAALRNGRQAVELATLARQLSEGKSPEVLDSLAAAYAEAGRFAEAVETARRAQELATSQNNKPLAAAIQDHCKLYETNLPFREKP